MSETAPSEPEPGAPLRRFIALRDLPKAAKTKKQDAAAKEERAAIAAAFGLLAVKEMTFDYALAPFGDDGWRVEGTLRAAVEQACVVTLEPVAARLLETFERSFAPGGVDPFDPDAPAVDIAHDEEDPPEPLGEGIDLGAVVLEALALGLDPYPRADGAAFAPIAAAPPGADPLETETRKPFAALAALKKSLEQGD
ncbi:MAG: DUF177 domain-containing protein [Pseudomonadota bacterium]